MAKTREEKTVFLIFSCYTYIPKVKLNTNWQIDILSKRVCVVDGIVSIVMLY